MGISDSLQVAKEAGAMVSHSDSEEEVEGLSDDDLSWGDYPIDSLFIRNETRTVHDVLRRMDKSYVMDPDFQRDFIWPIDKQSKFIESALMRIPLPVFYLAEDRQGKVIVVDGLQRLTTFKRFVDGEFKLRLPDQQELNNKGFGELAPKLQNRIEDCNLILYLIDSKAPERARLDIFERVNSGVPLTRQQMRNSLYMGEGTRFLKREASADIFLDATGRSLKTQTMRDREFVNRFCAFQLFTFKEYKDDMDDFLAGTLTVMNKMQQKELDDLSTEFRTSLTNNQKVFGKHAFRKHTNISDGRSVLNASLWDVMSTGMSRYETGVIDANVQRLRNAFYDLMDDDYFIASITYGTNDLRRVRHRFERANDMFQEVLG